MDFKLYSSEYVAQQDKIRALIDSGMKKFKIAHTIDGKDNNFCGINDILELWGDGVTDMLMFKTDKHSGYCDIARLEPLEQEDVVTALEHQVAEAKSKLESLEKQLEEVKEVESKKFKRWTPPVGDEYHFISGYGTVDCMKNLGHSIDRGAFSIGNCFRTEQEATNYLDALKVMEELRRCPGRKKFEQNIDNWVVELQISSEDDSCMLVKPNAYAYRVNGFAQVYFDSHESAQNAINAIGSDRIKKAVLTMAKCS